MSQLNHTQIPQNRCKVLLIVFNIVKLSDTTFKVKNTAVSTSTDAVSPCNKPYPATLSPHLVNQFYKNTDKLSKEDELI